LYALLYAKSVSKDTSQSKPLRAGGHGGVLRAYGVPFEVRSNRIEAIGKVVPFLPIGTKSSPQETTGRLYELRFDDKRHKGLHVLYRNRRAIARADNEEEIFDRFESDVTVYVADLAPEMTFLHAGVVALNRRAIVLPGRSMVGKSLLVSELLRNGATFYSDEFAVLDGQGRVHPYPRPLQMRKEGEVLQTRHPAENFGAPIGTEPLPISLIALTRYKAGASWRPKQLSAGKAVFELLRHTTGARRFPERALNTLRRVVENAQVFQGTRGEAQEALDWLMSRVETLPR
jgi:hypothetical protein